MNEIIAFFKKFPAIGAIIVIGALFIGYYLYTRIQANNQAVANPAAQSSTPAQIYAFDVTPPAPGTTTTPTPNPTPQPPPFHPPPGPIPRPIPTPTPAPPPLQPIYTAMTRQYGTNPSYDFPNNLAKGLPLSDINGNNAGYIPFNSSIKLASNTIYNNVRGQSAGAYQTYNGSYIGVVDVTSVTGG